ncbi:MAG: VWA domain-containing protein, partial [Chloroflexota bacterium]|nr:VWA domain-containing protein [Chloroflexota bacterium]
EALAVLQPITDDFNRQGLGTVTLTALPPGDMVEALRASQPAFDAAIPDSSFWLPRLDKAWAEKGQQESLTGLVKRFMLSPVVIATWDDVAAGLGANPGWGDFLRRVESDTSFRWSHPSAKTGPGFLAVLGEVYFAAGKTWGLTSADLDRQSTRDTFNRIEKSIAQYGESEEATLQALTEKGPAYLSAFVATERAVVRFNASKSARKLRAVYPKEGAAWADYPLTLLDGDWVSPQLRTLYVAFANYLTTAGPQRSILAAGYRTVNPEVPITASGSPLTAAAGVDPRQPQVALQIPEEAVVDRLLGLWNLLKRHSRQVWVVDTSGSMGDAQKLQRVKDALLVLIASADPEDEVGLIRFADKSQLMVPVGLMTDTQRNSLKRTVQSLSASGNTALLDATLDGYNLLASQPKDKINGLIVLTDGEENRSTTRITALADAIRKGNQQNLIVVFCIAYGGEAGAGTLNSIAGAAGATGQVRGSDPASIQRLYEDLQKYF